MKKHFTSGISALLLTAGLPAFSAPTFQQAAKDYAAGNYRVALQEFEALKASYPSNLQIHYYEGLCYQALGRLGEAKTEYSYVANANSGSLKPMAQAALSQLSRAGGSGGGGSSSSSGGSSMPGGATALASAASSTTAGDYKVRKVLEFYADW
jgi:tetratricopeptide (TPR) repeat protein